jgi:hypothetical protein
MKGFWSVTIYDHLRVRPWRRLPALSSLPGHTPAQEAKREADRKRLMSVPISAKVCRAAVASTPGMLRSCSIWDGSGATRTPIC